MVIRSVLERLDEDAVPASWWVRRKLLLVGASLVPVLLLAYSFVASLLSRPGNFTQDVAPVIVSALLITGVGAYVIWNSLSSLLRLRLAPTPRRARRVLTAAGRHI